MADERNTPKGAPPALPTRPAGLEPIRVRELRTSGATVVLPPPAKSSQLMAGKRAGGETITIQYEPWHRHHRVREIDGDSGKITREVCIPESWVSYVPEEWGAA